MLRYAALRYFLRSYITLCYVIMQPYATLCSLTLFSEILHYVMLRYAALRYFLRSYITLCNLMLRYAALRYFLRSYITLCYVMQPYAIF